MRVEPALFIAGEIIGTFTRVTSAELRAAANTEGLHAEYKQYLLILADCRDKLMPPTNQAKEDKRKLLI